MNTASLTDFIRLHKMRIFWGVFWTLFGVYAVIKQAHAHHTLRILLLVICWMVMMYGLIFNKIKWPGSA